MLLVDDHALVRDGIRRALEQSGEFRVLAEASSLDEARECLAEFQPDLVVVDIRLTDGNGLDLVRELSKDRPATGTVVITMYAGDNQMLEAQEAGASAYVTKDAPSADVLEAVRAAARNPQGFAADGWDEVQERVAGRSAPRLTRREHEVLELLVAGMGVSAISRRLYISESTTKTHVANIYAKLGAANRAQAVATALSEGLVLPD